MSSSSHPRRHSRIRSDHATELAEDYVEAIAEIGAAKEVCRAVDLAKHFGVSHVTVNKTVGRLVRDGYVETEPYGPVVLTAKGDKLAREAKARHETVYAFLVALGVSPKNAQIDSEGIEHHVSQETLKAMQNYLNQ